MDQDQEPINLEWLMKAAIGFFGSLITVAIINIWTTVNSINIELVRSQTRLVSLEEKVVANKDSYDDKIKALSDRVTIVEQRILK